MSGLQVEPSLLSLSVEEGVLAVLNNPTGCRKKEAFLEKLHPYPGRL